MEIYNKCMNALMGYSCAHTDIKNRIKEDIDVGSFLRRTWAEVDIDAIKHNFYRIRDAVDPNSDIMCVIKADAYGHGATFLGSLYETMPVEGFAVSNIEEAIQLRESGITHSVLILGFTPPDMVRELAENGISQAVFSEDYARELSEQAVRNNVKISIHIKVDTGMSRIGFMYQDKERDADSIAQMERSLRLPNLISEGIFTHFALSDEADEGRDATLRQYGCFMDAVERLKSDGFSFRVVHCSNSGAIIDYKQMHCDCVRAGIILYGLAPSPKLAKSLELRPAMKIKSVVAQVKTIEPGTPISYGGTFVADKPMKIATVPIGYADGYSRSLSNRAYMTIGGKKAPVVGRVCMDQVMVDVTDIEDVKSGDEIVVIGDGTDGSMTFDDVAAMVGTINYELVCLVGKRVPRVYIRHGKKVGIMDGILPGNDE